MADEAQPQFGALLREWRQRRHMSQLDLAIRVDVSTRHLSYVKTGRSNPSPTMIDRLGEGLDLALRERNALFLAAGYAPAYGRRPLNSPELTQVADALVRILEPRGVIVVIEAEHLCMTMRGVRKAGARTLTSAVRGMMHQPATRAEAMSLILAAR